MDYETFYDIAVYANSNWKGSFTQNEVAEFAQEYLSEWEESLKHNEPTHTIKELRVLLIQDLENGSNEVEKWLEQMENKFGF